MFWILLLLQTTAASEQAAIRSVLEQFQAAVKDGDSPAVACLFTRHGDIWDTFGRVAAGRTVIEKSYPAARIWSEIAGPFLAVEEIRILTANVALADATLTWYGSTVFRRRAHGLFVLQKEGAVWRIASYRIIAPGSGPPTPR